MELVDLLKLVKSINNANGVRKNNKNIVNYLNLIATGFSYMFFVFDIIFLTHSSIYFIVFGHLVNFGFPGRKNNLAILCHFLAPVTYCMNISADIFFIFFILTPFSTIFVLQRSKSRYKFIHKIFVLFLGSSSR